MAKRKLSPDERRGIAAAAAVKESKSPGRIVRVLVAPHTSEAGEPQVAVTSAQATRPILPSKPKGHCFGMSPGACQRTDRGRQGTRGRSSGCTAGS